MSDKVKTVTTEKTDIKDGKACHEFKSETKGGACGGCKEHVKETHEIKDGKETSTYKSETKH